MNQLLVDAPPSQDPIVRIFDTRKAEPAERFDAWEELVGLTCGPLNFARRDHPGVFDGTIVCGQFGEVQTSLIEAQPHAVERTERLIRNNGEGHIYVCGILDGTAEIRQDGNHTTAETGNLVTFDSSRPYSLVLHKPFKMVAVRFAHRLVGLTPLDTSRLATTSWSGRNGVSVLLSHLLERLADHMTELSPTSADQLGKSVTSLIAAMFTERLGSAIADPGLTRRALLLRVQAFAGEHLGNPALGPAMLARHHNISLRYLQILFQEHETSPARWIRDERLKRCYEDLGNPRFAHLSVANIGDRWGLPGASHFSRLFRERYDLTPRECRALPRRVAGIAG